MKERIGDIFDNRQRPGPMQGTLSPAFPILKKNFDADVTHRLDMQTLEWLYWIPMRVVVPASSGADGDVDIKSDAHFECFYVTGDYTTKSGGVDVGVNQMTVRISDKSSDLKLMNSSVPLNLFLSPGRSLVAGVAGNPSSSLFYPFPFHHIFGSSGGILAEFDNVGTTENIANLLFVGRKLRVE